jgi:hypothetical protein
LTQRCPQLGEQFGAAEMVAGEFGQRQLNGGHKILSRNRAVLVHVPAMRNQPILKLRLRNALFEKRKQLLPDFAFSNHD